MISKKTIAEIFDAMSIEDIVGDFVHLKKRGVNQIGLCPFHNEKTPSFTVSPSKNIYKCFGCGRGGNGVDFLMEHEALSYPEALRYIAKMYNIPIEEDESKTEDQTEVLYRETLQIVNNFALNYYTNALNETDVGKSVGLSYLKQRGFNEQTLRTFDIGFAAAQPRNHFTRAAVDQGYKLDILQALGLTNSYEKDFFFDRIMFPIHSLSGMVVAFAGRILKKNEKAPKYLNSPETEIYHKRKVLFGLHLAKKEIRNQNRCFLVEGYTDVMMLHQNGIHNVVATSGTSLTKEQIRLIKRYSENICLIFDADPAGIKAAIRGIDLILEEGLNVEILTLPEQQDPDSFVQEVGQDGFITYYEENTKDFLLFKAALGKTETDLNPVKATEVIQDLVESIAKIEDQIKRHLYLRETATLMNLPEEVLMEELNKKINKNHQNQKLKEYRQNRQVTAPKPEVEKNSTPSEATSIDQKHLLRERDLIRILIQHGHKMIDEDQNVANFVIDNISDVLDYFEHPTLRKILQVYIDFTDRGEVPSFHYLTHETSDDIRKTIIDLHEGKYDNEYSPNWINMWDMDLQTQLPPEKNHKRDVEESIMRFKLNKATQLCKSNLEEIKKYEAEDNTEEYLKHLQLQKKLIEIRNIFAQQFQTIVLK